MKVDPRAGTVAPAVSRTFLAAMALVAASRAPYILLHGRFWAEEGTLYFRHMAMMSGPVGVVWVPAHVGYVNVFVNLATAVASLVPLTVAPLVTAWFAFGVVLTMVWVAVAWPSVLLPNAGARIAASLMLVVGTLAMPEVWLTSLLCQPYFGLIGVLLLFVDVGRLTPRRAVIGLALLGVAGLSGVYAAALAPLFVLSAIRERSPRRWAQAGVVTATAAIQAASILYFRSRGDFNEKRATPGLGEAARSIAGVHLDGFVVGSPNVTRLADAVRAGSAPAAVVVGGLALAVVVFIGVLLWRAPTRWISAMLVAALVITELVVMFGSLGKGADGRYAVAPIGILTLMLVYGASTTAVRYLTPAAMGLAVLVTLVGLSQFWTASPNNLRCNGCAPWDEEVREWRAGESDELSVWPYDSDEAWVLVLPAGER